MIYVQRNKIPEPNIFSSKEMQLAEANLEKFYKGSKDSRSQKKYTKVFEAELRAPILESLSILFNNKCAYCESPVPSSNNSYDHFRPKYGARGLENEFSNEHYWWLTYNWNNFYQCCSKCGRFKSTWFPVDGKRSRVKLDYHKILETEKPLLIDPCHDNPFEHFLYKNEGTVDFLTQRGKVSIEILNLNRNDLVAGRAKAVTQTKELCDELSLKLLNPNNNWDRLQVIGKEVEKILNGTSSQPFLASRQQLLLELTRDSDTVQAFLSSKRYNLKLETRVLTSLTEIQEVVPEHKELNIEDKKTIEASLDLSKIRRVDLEKIEIKNFICFHELAIEFQNNSETTLEENEIAKKQRWYLFLGENGVGKSSILKAIAIALIDEKYRPKLQNYLAPNKLLRSEADYGFIKLSFTDGTFSLVEFSREEAEAKFSAPQPFTNLLGYGAIRLLPKKNIKQETGSFEGIKIENLFDYSVALADANNWLLKRSKKDFDRAAKALKDLMLLNEEAVLTRTNNEILVVEEGKPPVPIEQLSEGYKSVYAVAVDIMSSLSSENITYDLSEGIVLIDEIGTHLHPRWKMQVVERMRATFPKLQFVVTTHEPLCLRGLEKGEVVVLTKDENEKIVALTDLPDPSSLRIDQILTSEFFGLKSTFDGKTERVFEEYYQILAKDDKDRTQEEVSRMYELESIIPRIKHLGNDLREDLVYHVIDEILAKEVKKGGLIIKDELKKKATDKVRSLWDAIKSGKYGSY